MLAATIWGSLFYQEDNGAGKWRFGALSLDLVLESSPTHQPVGTSPGPTQAKQRGTQGPSPTLTFKAQALTTSLIYLFKLKTKLHICCMF